MAINNNIHSTPTFNSVADYPAGASGYDPSPLLENRVNTYNQYAKWYVGTVYRPDGSLATSSYHCSSSHLGFFAVRENDTNENECAIYIINNDYSTVWVNENNTYDPSYPQMACWYDPANNYFNYYFQFQSNADDSVFVGRTDVIECRCNIPLFDTMADAYDYIHTGKWTNAQNYEPEITPLYANWVCGYTNSNDTVYSLAVSCPSFYDSDSDYYGKNEIAKILLNIYYTIAGETISIYSNTYNYGETWTGKLSDIIGQSQMDVANNIAVGIASVLDIDDIIMKFYVYYPTEDGATRTAQGYIDFDHNNIESYGFAETPAGDTITFKSGVVLDDSDSDIDNPDPEKEDSDDLTDPTISDITGTGLLTKTYVLTPQEAQGIGQFLWGATFMQNIRLLNTSPIENIVSCKLFPFDMTGTSENVFIGNVDSGTAGQKVAQNVLKKSSNAIKVTPYYGEKADNLHFLDYDPYTKVEIFLPFIGIKELPTDIVMNKHIKIEWYIDLVCGTLETDVMVEYKKDGNGNPVYNCFYILSSQCGVDIPLTAQNLAQVQSAYIQNAIGGGVSLATGNVAGVVQSIAGAVTTQYHTQTTGTPSPSTSLQAQLDPYLRITRPVAKFVGQKSKKGVTPITPDDPANKNRTYFYKHLVGAPLYQVKNLGSLQGYTEVENPQIAIDGALSVEVEEIERLLESGVILEMPDILGA